METRFLDYPLYAGTVLQWLIALGITLSIILAVRVVLPRITRRIESLSQRTRLALDDALVFTLRATKSGLIMVIAVSVGSEALELAAGAQKLIRGAATIALFLQVGIWLSSLMQFWLVRSEQKHQATHSGAVASLAAVGFIGRIVLWSIMVLLVLDNLGINVTTLIAGLGIGGIAVALAVQNVLGDLFASLSIVIDKPFVAGDFIVIDDFMGTVEHVGLKTTRLRALDGEQLVFSNSDLLKSRLRNYKRMRERRIVYRFGLRYDSTPEQLERVPAIVRRLIESHKQARFERSHFKAFGDSSFDFETVFWMTTPDYNVYMDVQQQLNLDLMRELGRIGVEFALPTQATVKTGGEAVDEEPRRPAPARAAERRQ